MQELLEILEIPYTGPGVLACERAMDKVVAKAHFAAAGIDTPPAYAFRQEAFRELGAGDAISEIRDRLGLPLVVKPAKQGSALGITVAHEPADVPAALMSALAYDDRVLLERFVPGRELAVSVLGTGEPWALPVVEAIPRGRDFYDFEARYTPGLTDFVAPALLSDAVAQEVARVAIACYRALGCRGREPGGHDPRRGRAPLGARDQPDPRDDGHQPAARRPPRRPGWASTRWWRGSWPRPLSVPEAAGGGARTDRPGRGHHRGLVALRLLDDRHAGAGRTRGPRHVAGLRHLHGRGGGRRRRHLRRPLAAGRRAPDARAPPSRWSWRRSWPALAAAGEWAGVRVVPQIRRQVPEPWRRLMPLPLVGRALRAAAGPGLHHVRAHPGGVGAGRASRWRWDPRPPGS